MSEQGTVTELQGHSEENITGEAMPEPVAGGSAPWSSNPWVWVIEFNRRPA